MKGVKLSLGIVALLMVLLLALPMAVALADGASNDDNTLEYMGIVEAMPAGGLTGEWRIGGKTFQANQNTAFDQEHGPLAAGVCAKVEYTLNNGVNVAVKIESKEAYECGGPNTTSTLEFKGTVEDKPAGTNVGTWTISGVDFEATSNTQFQTTHGPIGVGTCVDVKYVVQANQNVAIRIESQDPSDCQSQGGQPQNPVKQEVYGTVQAMPSNGLIGTWRVNGLEYQATNTPIFEQLEGTFAVGVCVEIEYVVQNNVRLALKIRTEDFCSVGTNVQRDYGVVQSLPNTSDLTGTWTIDGHQYQVTTTTQLDTPHGPFAVGACVEVEYQLNGTTRQALQIRTESADECGVPVDDGHGGSQMLEAKGLIEVMPQGLVGVWTIAGQTYTATAQTRFEQDHGLFEVGRCVEVKYTEGTSGRQAHKIETKRQQECGQPGSATYEAYGVVEALPITSPGLLGTWTIGGVDYEVTQTTQLKHGPFSVGLLVKVKFTVNPDGTFRALEIEGKHAVDDSDFSLAQVYGRIDAYPANWIGEWIVGGVSYTATNTTKFEQGHGNFGVGACVKVRYVDRNSTREAVKIETEDDAKCASGGTSTNPITTTRLYGFVEQMPAQGFVGTWQVGGVLFEVTAATRITEEHGALVEGAFVKVEYVRQNNINVALEIETHVPPEAGQYTFIGTLQQNGTGWSVKSVGGTTPFTVTDATILDDSHAPLVDGQPVVVNGYAPAGSGGVARLSGTSIVATRVTAIAAFYNVYLPMMIR